MTKAELVEKLRGARSEYVSESDHYDAFDWAIRMAEELDESSPASIDFDPVFKEARDRVYQGDMRHAFYCDGWQDAVRYLREKISMAASGRDEDSPQRKVQIGRIEGEVHWAFTVWQEEGNDEWALIHEGPPTLDFSEAETESREWLRNNP